MFADVLCLPQTFTSDFLAGALAGAYVCSRSVKLGQAELINIHEASSPSAHTSRVVIRPMAYRAISVNHVLTQPFLFFVFETDLDLFRTRNCTRSAAGFQLTAFNHGPGTVNKPPPGGTTSQ